MQIKIKLLKCLKGYIQIYYWKVKMRLMHLLLRQLPRQLLLILRQLLLLERRPPLLLLSNASDVTLRSFRLLNAAQVHAGISGRRVRIDGVSVRAPDYQHAPNTDGIDLAVDGAHVSNVDVVNGDDSICLKVRVATNAGCRAPLPFTLLTRT